jgi:hypothetical protein
MSQSNLDSFLSELAKSSLLRLFEPDSQGVRNHLIGQSRYISAKLRVSEDDSFIRFPKPYGRNTTIAGVWMYLEKPHPNEFLVTAFGVRQGTTLSRPARYEGIHISGGSEHNVMFSPKALDYIAKHSRIKNAEILIFHNHPANFLSNIFGKAWVPLPSTADRNVLCKFSEESIADWFRTGNYKNVRFFLIENKCIHEFNLSPIEKIPEILALIERHRG